MASDGKITDKELKAAGLSRHELKIEHRRLTDMEKCFKIEFQQMRNVLNQFAEGYIESGAHNPWSRNSILHQLVESVTSESVLSNIRQCIDQTNLAAAPQGQRGGIPDLMAKVDAIKEAKQTAKNSAGKGVGEKRPLLTGGQPIAKGKQLLRKVKKMTGFIDETIEDEDVMSNDKLIFCMQTREKRIKTMNNEFRRTHETLSMLRSNYETVRSQCFCCSYFNLKKIIESAIEDVDADTRYET